jgi:hypothetical protein
MLGLEKNVVEFPVALGQPGLPLSIDKALNPKVNLDNSM